MNIYKFEKPHGSGYAIVAAKNAKYALRKLHISGYQFEIEDCSQEREEHAVILELAVPNMAEIYQVRTKLKAD